MDFFSSIRTPSSLEELEIHFNKEGWGPVSGEQSDLFQHVPYSHFDKKEKFGRPADFVQQAMGLGYQRSAYQQRKRDEYLANNDFNFKHDIEEDNTFQLVDTSKTHSRGRHTAQRKQHQHMGRTAQQISANRLAGRTVPQGRFGQQMERGDGYGAGGRGAGGGAGGRSGRAGGAAGRGGWTRRFDNRGNRQDRAPSLTVGADWSVVEEFDLAQLLKLTANQPKVKELLTAGYVEQYDESYDKITSRSTRPLRPVLSNKLFFDVPASDDPILNRMAVEQLGNVYATDAVLGQLMAAPRSVYSWDLLVQKVDGMIFLDQREESGFDLLSVSETSQDPPVVNEDTDEINHPGNLALEATRINQSFSQLILMDEGGERKTFEPNPFFSPEDAEGGEEPASTAYRYRRFDLGSIRLVARCELHGWTNKRGEDQFMTSHALHEWDYKNAGVNSWRQKIDQQRGAILATELKNNSARLAKWTAQSLLAGADQMKLGYVTRNAPNNALEHTVLATQFFKPRDFAAQINLSLNNVWGIVKMMCEMLMRKPDGKYVLLKDPNKPILRVYSVPDEFEEGDDDDDEDDDDAADGAAPSGGADGEGY